MIYLGTLGRMIGIKCPASQNVEHEERYTFQTTLEGRRKAQVRPRGPRTWSLQTSDATTQAQVATLMQFAQGAWGPGPFVFLPADAPVTNLLTPAASLCGPGEFVLTSGVTVTEGAPMRTPDGWAARSLIKTTPNGLFLGKDMIPVLPGTPVTGSAYIRGAGGKVSIHWYDSTGTIITSVLSTETAESSVVKRCSLTAMPPSNAVSCRLAVTASVQQAAWPAVTWTDKLQTFGEGQGCTKSVVSTASRSLVMAVPGFTYSNLSFNVTEVG